MRTQLAEKLKRILKNRSGVPFPLIIAVTLALIIILCGVSEYFRLNIIAAGGKEATEDAIISAVNDNYANVYHGVREGYSGGYTGGYMPDGAESWETAIREGDIYTYLDGTLGTRIRGGRLLPSMHITLKVQSGIFRCSEKLRGDFGNFWTSRKVYSMLFCSVYFIV